MCACWKNSGVYLPPESPPATQHEGQLGPQMPPQAAEMCVCVYVCVRRGMVVQPAAAAPVPQLSKIVLVGSTSLSAVLPQSRSDSPHHGPAEGLKPARLSVLDSLF